MRFLPKKILILAFACLSLSLHAKDLYVSSSDGDDNLSYDQVSIDSPWKTLNRAIYNLKAGDTLNIRGGTYTPQYTMYTRSDYTSKNSGGHPNEDMNAESGTAQNPITIQSYNNEKVVIDLSVVDTFISLDNKDYWIFDGFEIINAGKAFIVAYDNEAKNHIFRNLKMTASKGGDNWGLITLGGSESDGAVIENCILKGPGTSGIHHNTSSIYLTRLNKVTIRNNEIHNAPIGIYFKHANTPQTSNRSDVDINIENNFIYNNSRRSIEFNAVGARVVNNVFGLNSPGIRNNEANGYPGGDHNLFEHNTFLSGNITLSADTQSGDPLPGSMNNTIQGNIFFDTLDTHRYSADTHNTTSDYNIYTTSIAHIENRVNYSLVDWKSHSGQDQNSVVGTPEFSGTDFSKLSSLKLKSSSIGYKDFNNRDIGADISRVGATEISTTSPPAPPTSFSVELL